MRGIGAGAVLVGVALIASSGCGLRASQLASSPMNAAVAAIVAQAAADPDDTDAQAAAIAALGEPAIAPLGPVLHHPDQRLRLFAVDALGRMKSANTVDPLLEVLADDSWEVRQAVVETLGQLRSPRAVQPLMDRYGGDDEAVVRYECLESLGLIGDRRATALLVRETSNEDPYTRMWAMHGLCTAGDPEAGALLVRLLQDPDVKVRRDVMRHCGPVARTDAGRRLLLQMMLDDPDFETAYLARENLAADAQASAGPEVRVLVSTAARQAMSSSDPERARRGAFLLANLGDAAAFDALLSALHDRSPLIRHHAAYLLAEIRDVRAVRPLIGVLKDPVPMVQLTAVVSLQRYAKAGNEEAKAALTHFRPDNTGRH